MNLKSDKISLQKLHYNDVDSWLEFAWHYSPARMKETFSKVGVLVEDEGDVIALSKLAASGGDMRGELLNKEGNPIRFSVLEVVKSIPENAKELDNKFTPVKGNYLLKVNKRMGKS